MKVVSHEELKKHNSEGDVWMAIHGLVYDVSKFMPDHPGGHTCLPSERSKLEQWRRPDPSSRCTPPAGCCWKECFRGVRGTCGRSQSCAAMPAQRLVQDALHSEQARAEEAIVLKGMLEGCEQQVPS